MRKGTRPGSIRAGYVDVRFGKGKVVGYDEDDIDYTMDELGDAANEIRRDNALATKTIPEETQNS